MGGRPLRRDLRAYRLSPTIIDYRPPSGGFFFQVLSIFVIRHLSPHGSPSATFRCPSQSASARSPEDFRRDSEHLFERLVVGKLEPAEIAGMLIALRMKGEPRKKCRGGRALSAAATRSRGPIICSPIAAAPAAMAPG